MLIELANIVLWISTAIVIGCYAANSWFVLTKKSSLLLYQSFNLIGSIGFVWGMYVLGVFQSMVLNIVWGAISIIALWKIFVHH